MLRLRRRTLGLAALLAALFLSLRPVEPLERALACLALPARLLGELAAPLRPLAASTARAEGLGREQAAAEREVGFALAAEERAARPADPDLLAGRRLAHAAVLEALRTDRDHLLLALPPEVGLRRGLPVVRGEHLVGLLVEVDDARGRAVLRLLTDGRFRIGASAEAAPGAEPPRLVVGGLAPEARGRSLRLAVHNPSRKDLAGSFARVLEPAEEEREAALANGYRLGRLAAEQGPWAESALVLVPELDFEGGLSRLVVLLPAEEGRPAEIRLAEDPLAPQAWSTLRVALAADAAPGRATRALLGGTLSSAARALEPGAAARAGPWLVGRVARAGPFEAELALLGDPGLVVSAQALLAADLGAAASVPSAADERELVPLGRLVALARTGAGRSRWLWSAHVPLAGPAGKSRRARLFSASGERGLPSGLLLGEAFLPCGPGPHLIELEAGVDGGALTTVSVRRAPGEARP